MFPWKHNTNSQALSYQRKFNHIIINNSRIIILLFPSEHFSWPMKLTQEKVASHWIKVNVCGAGPPVHSSNSPFNPKEIFLQHFKNGLRFFKSNKHMSLSIMTNFLSLSSSLAAMHSKVRALCLAVPVFQKPGFLQLCFQEKGGRVNNFRVLFKKVCLQLS